MIINSCYIAFSSYPRLPPNSIINFHNSFSYILQQMNGRNAWRGEGFTFKYILRIKSCTQNLHSSLVKMIFKKCFTCSLLLWYTIGRIMAFQICPYLNLWNYEYITLKRDFDNVIQISILKLEGDPGLSRWARCSQVSL